MLNLIPQVKNLEYTGGNIKKKAIYFDCGVYEERLERALLKLPFDKDGVKLHISVGGGTGEDYELTIAEDSIAIVAPGIAGAFYAIQTLRQIFTNDIVPCLCIKDCPDFTYRGFYQDITRGKVPTVETLKKLIDLMAYCKLNSLQLYVEHTFAFKECRSLNEKMGYLTEAEIKELDRYCHDNFIEFIPSLSTFGHMYEILEQKEYRHLRVLDDFEAVPNFWMSRMQHHTIDPLKPGSIDLVKSLIDQYYPLFKTDTFNICCDETFDLYRYSEEGRDVGEIYVGFVKKIIDYLYGKNKRVMMWADILLQHPETIESLPSDIYFLNWDYGRSPSEDNIIRFSRLGRHQIVCPGTGSWSRLCENFDAGESNISLMAEYGHRHGAVGVLNTNWGDWGNPASLELAVYGLVLGAEKSWSVSTKADDVFYHIVDSLIYEKEGAVEFLRTLSRLHDRIGWNRFGERYFALQCGDKEAIGSVSIDAITEIQSGCVEFIGKLGNEVWKNDEYREEMLIAAEGICLMAELTAKMAGYDIKRFSNAAEWTQKYRAKWTLKNKESELRYIEEMFLYCEETLA